MSWVRSRAASSNRRSGQVRSTSDSGAIEANPNDRRSVPEAEKGPWGPYLNQFPAGATKVLGAIRGDRITPVKDGSQGRVKHSQIDNERGPTLGV